MVNSIQSLAARILSFALLIAISFPLTVFGDVQSLQNPLAFDSLTEFLVRLLEVIALIGFPIIVLFIIYIGFLFVSSEGNPDKLKKAKSYFMWALVGALIVLGAQALAIAIQGTVDQLRGGL